MCNLSSGHATCYSARWRGRGGKGRRRGNREGSQGRKSQRESSCAEKQQRQRPIAREQESSAEHEHGARGWCCRGVCGIVLIGRAGVCVVCGGAVCRAWCVAWRGGARSHDMRRKQRSKALLSKQWTFVDFVLVVRRRRMHSEHVPPASTVPLRPCCHGADNNKTLPSRVSRQRLARNRRGWPRTRCHGYGGSRPAAIGFRIGLGPLA
jgi:hypothetical protein